MSKRIPLSKGLEAIVDDEDYEWLSAYNWHVIDGGSGLKYAVRSLHNQKTKMHRLIMDAKKGQTVDHINGDGLDNRRCNLRFATMKQQQANSKKRKGSSKYKGVHWSEYHHKWCACFHRDGKTIHLGYYATEIEAARDYNEVVAAVDGEFARLNDV
jgi:hypothetical protein